MSEKQLDVLISDPTLRDGNHAVKHQLNCRQIAEYAAAADAAGVAVVEVGHGNGLGASSLQVGLAAIDDETLLRTARANLKSALLGIHVIPGFATINKDLRLALDCGVDVFRIASHCTEADVTARHICWVREHDRTAYGVLMMTHMVPPEVLCEEAAKMESYGAEAVVIMDSAGAFLPDEVSNRVSQLVETLSIPVGFHAHNNLGMGIANSVAALNAGAKILDATARGFGAGAGNATLEVLVAVLEKLGRYTGIDLYKLLDAGELAERTLMTEVPTPRSLSIISGMSGVFSGFNKHVERLASEFGVDPRDVLRELGQRRVLAGQEDVILQVTLELARGRKAA